MFWGFVCVFRVLWFVLGVVDFCLLWFVEGYFGCLGLGFRTKLIVFCGLISVVIWIGVGEVCWQFAVLGVIRY